MTADSPDTVREAVLRTLRETDDAVPHAELVDAVTSVRPEDPPDVEKTIRALQRKGEIYDRTAPPAVSEWKVTRS